MNKINAVKEVTIIYQLNALINSINETKLFFSTGPKKMI